MHWYPFMNNNACQICFIYYQIYLCLEGFNVWPCILGIWSFCSCATLLLNIGATLRGCTQSGCISKFDQALRNMAVKVGSLYLKSIHPLWRFIKWISMSSYSIWNSYPPFGSLYHWGCTLYMFQMEVFNVPLGKGPQFFFFYMGSVDIW